MEKKISKTSIVFEIMSVGMYNGHIVYAQYGHLRFRILGT